MKREGLWQGGGAAPSRIGPLPHKLTPDSQFAHCAGGVGGEKHRCKCEKAPRALRRSQQNRVLPVYEVPPAVRRFMSKPGEEKMMRLDKYLKVSRIIKRRTVANDACDAGRVLVNGKPARASYDVKIGDILELQLGSRSVKAQVLSVNEYAKKEMADEMYKILSDEPNQL